MAAVAPIRAPEAAVVRGRVLAWWDRHARVLAWRARPGARRDPYRVWLSEIMLQQTTVSHAAPYFRTFIRRWPTIERLAAAPEAEVMAAWAGLGYYARARNLVACARVVAGELGGVFPGDEEDLRALPGVGAYTAAAIAAIAFDRPANVVDANIERVIARLYAVEAQLPAAKGEIVALAGALAPAERPGDWAQALMDLGAMVCRPTAPDCERCPLEDVCAGRRRGDPQTFPRRAPKAERPHRHGVAFVAWREGQVALVRRPPRGLLGGMLGLPTTPWRAERWSGAQARAAAPWPADWRALGEVSHVFTHFSLSLEVWGAEATGTAPDVVWLPITQATAASPTVFRKAIDLVFAGGRAKEKGGRDVHPYEKTAE